jgi:hypothetical protein
LQFDELSNEAVYTRGQFRQECARSVPDGLGTPVFSINVDSKEFTTTPKDPKNYPAQTGKKARAVTQLGRNLD